MDLQSLKLIYKFNKLSFKPHLRINLVFLRKSPIPQSEIPYADRGKRSNSLKSKFPQAFSFSTRFTPRRSRS